MNDPEFVDTLSKLLVKYGSIAIDNIDNVTMQQNVSVSADNITSNYTRLSFSINEKDTLDISKAILTTAKSDTELINLCLKLGVCTQEEYDDAIKEGLSSISEELKYLKKAKSNGEVLFKMNVLVNDQGKIAGRSLIIDNEYQSMNIGYKTTKCLTKMGVEAWVKSDGQYMIHANGRLTAGLKGVSGDFIVTYPGYDFENPSVLYVDFNNVKYSKTDTMGSLNGEFTVSGSDLGVMSYNLKLNGEPGKQDILFDMLQDNKSIINIAATTKDVPFTDFSGPSSNDKIYDANTQINDYFDEANVKEFLNGIKEKSSLKGIDSYIDEIIAEYDANKESITEDADSFNPLQYSNGFFGYGSSFFE